ncbi:alpha-mannosidase [Leptolyngbya iicbica]|uniref:Alpha-mannosidase n=2 Tax=Cyanophyceae TaxID=3028117 RepID=A0A4V2E1V7_9CYAN|nr:alpha-mannosidase [Leptolyngbya sp. LK]RZM75457.1 alpha-mannosidase [Leptolyngbya sp. LK]
MNDASRVESKSPKTAISATVQRLQGLSQRSLQTAWHLTQEDLPKAAVLGQNDWQSWPIASTNARDHIAWERGQKPLWLCQQIVVPETLNDFPLEGLTLQLSLTWWAEAVAIYVDGELRQEGDLFDYFGRIKLSDRVTPGDTFHVAIYLVSPGHDDGALVRSTVMYETANPALPEPGFVADELTVLQTFADPFAPDKLSDLAAAIAPLDWTTVTQQTPFLKELRALRDRLQPFSAWIKQRQITCVGHAHLDLAWLWPVADTWRAAERTFRSVLALQQDFPEMTYTHSSPALFDWLETHQPDLFQAVLTAVKGGHWSIDAGLWVEPELNTLGGESLARQILYGQRYAQSRFGQMSAIAWLPDSFGFSWQLPQLLKLGGVDYFATQKLRWNEATPFPHSLFEWQGLDETRITSLTLPPIGSDIDAPQMASYAAEWEAKTGLTEMLWLPGMGDHGGGPTRDMLERARRWADSPFFPELRFDTPLNHLQRLTAGTETVDSTNRPLTANGGSSSQAATSPTGEATATPLPVWNDELYLELHRGCYTVHADQKWYNRRCEDALREAELYSAIAQMLGHFAYPQAALETAWKRVLFNQFHDILPGTAIPEVFETTNPDWQAAYDAAQGIRTDALAAIAAQLLPRPLPPTGAISVCLFNSLSWEQTALVEVPLADLPNHSDWGWRVVDPATGATVVSQLSPYSDRSDTPPCQAAPPMERGDYLLFEATVPPVGYRRYWLVPEATESTASDLPHQPSDPTTFELKNDFLSAEVDPVSGELRSLTTPATPQSVLRNSANQLQAFRDAEQYWDAWDIAPDYQDHPLPAATVASITWLESGPLRQRLRVVRHVADSRIQQDYVLERSQPYLKVVTTADWQACQVVLKAAFPVTFEAEAATYEIPFGAIARPTAPTDPHEQAKWEVPAYRWADLSSETMGLSILTDYKHGFDAHPDQLRLTLLKAPLWPNPQADRGRHQFTYGLYPHAGDWRTGQTPQHAIAFNTPLQLVVGQPENPALSTDVEKLEGEGHEGSLLRWSAATTHLAALKQSEDDPGQYILRVWDLYGAGAQLDVDLLVDGHQVQRTSLLEAAIAVEQPAQLRPWEIATLKTPAFINKSCKPQPSAAASK